MTEEPTLNTRVKNAIASLKEASDLAQYKDDPLTPEERVIIAEACEDAIIAIRLLWKNHPSNPLREA